MKKIKEILACGTKVEALPEKRRMWRRVADPFDRLVVEAASESEP